MGSAILDLCAFVVREGWEHREDGGDHPRSLAQKAVAEADALRARCEKAEAERDAAIEGNAAVFFSAEDRARTEAERDAFAADNAMLRALLQGMVDAGERAVLNWRNEPFTLRRLDAAKAALSAPAPGAGCVVLTREEADDVDAVLENVDRFAPALIGREKMRGVRDLLRGKVKP